MNVSLPVPNEGVGLIDVGPDGSLLLSGAAGLWETTTTGTPTIPVTQPVVSPAPLSIAWLPDPGCFAELLLAGTASWASDKSFLVVEGQAYVGPADSWPEPYRTQACVDGQVGQDGFLGGIFKVDPDERMPRLLIPGGHRPDVECLAGSCLTMLRTVTELTHFPYDGSQPVFTYSGDVTGTTGAMDPFGQGGVVAARVSWGSTPSLPLPPSGYTLVSITCDAPASTSTGRGSVSVTVPLDGRVTCTFLYDGGGAAPGNHDPVAANDLAHTFNRGNGSAPPLLHRRARQRPRPGLRSVGRRGSAAPGARDSRPRERRRQVPTGGRIRGRRHLLVSGRRRLRRVSDGSITVMVRRRSCVLENGLDPCGDIEVGDILVDNGDNFFEKFFGGSWWSHAGIVTGKADTNGDGIPEIEVVDTIPGRGSQRADIHFTSWNEPIPFGVGTSGRARRRPKSRGRVRRSTIGTPYSIMPWAGIGENSYYCSGLVWRAYNKQGYDLRPSVKLPGASGAFYVGNMYVTPDDVAENKFTSGINRRFVQANYGSGAVEVVGTGVELVVLSPDDRRVGEDAFGHSWDDVPNAEHRRNMFGPSVVADGLDGTWTIELTAREATTYRLDLHFPSAANDASGSRTGIIPANGTVTIAASDLATHPPRAALQATRSATNTPLAIRLDATATTDPDDVITRYGWDFDNDGSVDLYTDGPVVEHTYPASTVAAAPAVLVEDASGGVGSARVARLVVDPTTGDFAPRPMLSVATSTVRRSTPVAVAATGFASDEVTSWVWLVDDQVAESPNGAELTVAFDTIGTHTLSVAPTDRPDLAASISVVVFDPAPQQLSTMSPPSSPVTARRSR